jgi:hypothetical protein
LSVVLVHPGDGAVLADRGRVVRDVVIVGGQDRVRPDEGGSAVGVSRPEGVGRGGTVQVVLGLLPGETRRVVRDRRGDVLPDDLLQLRQHLLLPLMQLGQTLRGGPLGLLEHVRVLRYDVVPVGPLLLVALVARVRRVVRLLRVELVVVG